MDKKSNSHPEEIHHSNDYSLTTSDYYMPQVSHNDELRTKNSKQKVNPVIPSKNIPFIPSKSLVSIRVNSWFKKIPNKPNFKRSQNDVSPFPTNVYRILSPVYCKKNKPKTNPIKPNSVSIRVHSRFEKNDKRTQFAAPFFSNPVSNFLFALLHFPAKKAVDRIFLSIIMARFQ